MEIFLSQQLPGNKINSIPENQRSLYMFTGLTSVLGNGYSVTCLGNDNSHYCPFSGGGDVAILKSGCYSAATILDADADSDNEEPGTPCPQLPNVSPPKQGEYCCAAIENKVAHTLELERNALLQLQANMMLLCARLLLEVTTSPSPDQNTVQVLSCYGILVGGNYPLTILKLTIDFEKDRLKYEELFSLSPCAFYPVFIDKKETGSADIREMFGQQATAARVEKETAASFVGREREGGRGQAEGEEKGERGGERQEVRKRTRGR